jgi:tetratricopeptide (TPR) repeat protein
MKKLLLITSSFFSLIYPIDTLYATPPVNTEMMTQIAVLQTEWAKIKYQIKEEDVQIAHLRKLEDQASVLSKTYRDYAEPKIWEGIILSTDAGISGGFGALNKVKEAKKLFESSLEQDPTALNASAYTSLGSLFYQVPGWPIGFGDNDKAEEYLKLALKFSPNEIDSNFFYADFLFTQKKYGVAKTYFEKALQAAPRPNREIADHGRRAEIKEKLALLELEMKHNSQ